MKFTGAQPRVQDDSVSPEIHDWWEARLPVRTSLRTDVVPGDGKGRLWWDPVRFYTDLSAAYRFKLLGGKVRTKVQLNGKNAFEGGRLQPIAINPDGRPHAHRITDGAAGTPVDPYNLSNYAHQHDRRHRGTGTGSSPLLAMSDLYSAALRRLSLATRLCNRRTGLIAAPRFISRQFQPGRSGRPPRNGRADGSVRRGSARRCPDG